MNVMKSVCVYLFPLLVLTCYSQERSNVGEYNMIVTPKEIDDLIENMKDIVARGINFAI